MTLDLTALDAAYRSLQSASGANPAVKAWAAQVQIAVHALNAPPLPQPSPTPTPRPAGTVRHLAYTNLHADSFVANFPADHGDQFGLLIMANPDGQNETAAIVALAKQIGAKLLAYYNYQDATDHGEPVADGVPTSVCAANGWLALYNGQPMTQGARGFPDATTAAIGNQTYISTWCDNVIRQCKQLGLDGAYIDNVIENGGYWIVGDHWPDPPYDTQQAWADAHVAALRIIKARFSGAGLLVAGNVIAWGDIGYVDGDSDRAWAARVAPYLDFANKEGWLYYGNGQPVAPPIDVWVNLLKDYEAAGVGFLAGTSATPTQATVQSQQSTYLANTNGKLTGGVVLDGDQIRQGLYPAWPF